MIVHLIDGTYELFRHFFGIRRFKKSDPQFGAVAGVLGTVAQMLEGGATHIGVATDHIIRLIEPNRAADQLHSGASRPPAGAARRGRPVNRDPAFDLPGLLWNVERIDAPQAWRSTRRPVG